MIIIVQILTSLLVILSLGLIIAIPVTFALPNEWENSKNSVFQLARLWASIVLVTGVANSFA